MNIYLALLLAGTAPVADPPTSMRAAIEKAVRDGLKDPESARFKWLQVADRRFYCGFVNAKNAYGGYVGFQPFHVEYYKTDGGSYQVGKVHILSSASSDTSGNYWALTGQCEGVYNIGKPPAE